VLVKSPEFEQAVKIMVFFKNYQGIRLLHHDIEEMEAEILLALTNLLKHDQTR
jgi:hypothetical protein